MGDGRRIHTNEGLKQWVKAYLQCFNPEKVSANHALEIVNDKFGTDLSKKKKLLEKLIPTPKEKTSATEKSSSTEEADAAEKTSTTDKMDIDEKTDAPEKVDTPK